MSISKPLKELSFDFDPSDENSNATYYDDSYFDSDISECNTEDEGESSIEKDREGSNNFTVVTKKKKEGLENLENKRKTQRKKLSPDELLYDPHMDEDDERWLENKITQYSKSSAKSKNNKNNSSDIISGTDAIISCPMCFTNLIVTKKKKEGLENLENKRKTQRKKLSPDELLYDPHMDEDDERWLENKITQYSKSSAKSKNNKNNSSDIISGTDAIISCPMCFTNLSYHTQRHETYVHQYRAIFVENCKVIQSEQLIYQDRPRPTKINKRGKSSSNQQQHQDQEQQYQQLPPFQQQPEQQEIYYLVVCAICGTKVAVIDQEEVYHFFNIIES
ncbi:hypothetical protein Glove_172g52 [Diversispora epigaea]|uniref:E2F-associated phosphoprotein n=1 Tax=Diversispora epigaea TaxID=1348612 RepID=A0A397IYV5_9GLOM|nr:hypothetical protein Glove_172g52 [Diversispora epigaea]